MPALLGEPHEMQPGPRVDAQTRGILVVDDAALDEIHEEDKSGVAERIFIADTGRDFALELEQSSDVDLSQARFGLRSLQRPLCCFHFGTSCLLKESTRGLEWRDTPVGRG